MLKKILPEFEIDLRSISLARILLSLICLFYFFECLKEVEALYSSDSIISLIDLTLIDEKIPSVHLFRFIQEAFAVRLVFCVGIISSLFLLVGYLSRLAIFVIWFIATAVYWRFPDLLYGGDQLLKITLFWFFFFPLESYFSLRPKKQVYVFPFVTFFFYFQLFVIYLMSIFYKFQNPKWIPELDALYYVLHADYLLRPVGYFLSTSNVYFLKGLSLFTIIIEFIAGVSLVLFFKNKLRISIVISLVLFHFLIWVAVDVGFFSHLCAVWWIALIPSNVWNKFRINSDHEVFKSRQSGVIACFLFICFLSIATTSINQLSGQSLFKRNFSLLNVANTLQINQYWGMFATKPPLDYDGWYNIHLVLKNGEKINALDNSKNLKIERPKDQQQIYPTIHWRTLVRKFRMANPELFYESFAKYQCGVFKKGNANLKSVLLIFADETISSPSSASIHNNSIKYTEYNFECD